MLTRSRVARLAAIAMLTSGLILRGDLLPADIELEPKEADAFPTTGKHLVLNRDESFAGVRGSGCSHFGVDYSGEHSSVGDELSAGAAGGLVGGQTNGEVGDLALRLVDVMLS